MLTENGLEDEREPSPEIESRPWGRFVVLDEGLDFKVERIEVIPGKRLSYQRHGKRSEHWFVVRGTAKVTLNENEFLDHALDEVDIGREVDYQVETPNECSMLIVNETKNGSYFGEDDIVRIEDDFGRTE